MSWIAAAIIGSAAIGGIASYAGAKKQAGAADRASQAQLEMFGQTRDDLAPWRNQGATSLAQLQGLTGPDGAFMQPFGLDQFYQSPGYQFRLEQGMNAINKGAAARGNYYAPQTLQDLGKFQQGMASDEFGNAYNRYVQDQQRQFGMLQTLSGSGQNAAAQTGALGADAVSRAGQFGMQGANATAEGYMGMANAASGAGLGLANYGMYLSQLQQPSYMGSALGYGRPGDNLRPIG